MITILEELKKAISQLTPQELADFRIWFAEFDRQRQKKMTTDGDSSHLNKQLVERLKKKLKKMHGHHAEH